MVQLLVGSLDESGFLTKDDATLADELAFNEYIDTTPEEVARLAGLMQRHRQKTKQQIHLLMQQQTQLPLQQLQKLKRVLSKKKQEKKKLMLRN